MTSYRVHTVVIGRNLPVIVQHLPAKPVVDAMPLLRLMLQANARPIEDEMFQVVAGPEA
jgi:hypothetical protein